MPFSWATNLQWILKKLTILIRFSVVKARNCRWIHTNETWNIVSESFLEEKRDAETLLYATMSVHSMHTIQWMTFKTTASIEKLFKEILVQRVSKYVEMKQFLWSAPITILFITCPRREKLYIQTHTHTRDAHLNAIVQNSSVYFFACLLTPSTRSFSYSQHATHYLSVPLSIFNVTSIMHARAVNINHFVRVAWSGNVINSILLYPNLGNTCDHIKLWNKKEKDKPTNKKKIVCTFYVSVRVPRTFCIYTHTRLHTNQPIRLLFEYIDFESFVFLHCLHEIRCTISNFIRFTVSNIHKWIVEQWQPTRLDLRCLCLSVCVYMRLSGFDCHLI